jgi:MOSC domain-containing protein YiiM
MKLISLNVAMPDHVSYGRQTVHTGGHKQPVAQAMVHTRNLEGDGQADLDNHGRDFQAVCVYPHNHYAYWHERLGVAWGPGAFSENFTVDGALETEVCIGDVWQAGSNGVRVQVSAPRMPCGKLAARLGQPKIIEWIIDTSYSGFYMRVLSEGLVRAGDEITVVERHPARISIAQVNALVYQQQEDQALAEMLIEMAEYPEAGKYFMRRLI